MNILVIDVGGTHVKLRATGAAEPRKFPSGPALNAEELIEGVNQTVDGWSFDRVSIGFPGVIKNNQIVGDPNNLAPGWVGFDFAKALGKPVKLINDAAMQALGSYQGEGRMLFIGLGTGLGSALVIDGNVISLELNHLPYKKGNMEDYVGLRGLKQLGKKKWKKHVSVVVAALTAAFTPDDIVLGGGNTAKLADEELPPLCRRGSNANAFVGGERLWQGGESK